MMRTRDEKWLAAVLTFYGLVTLSIVGFLLLVDSCTRRSTDDAYPDFPRHAHRGDAGM